MATTEESTQESAGGYKDLEINTANLVCIDRFEGVVYRLPQSLVGKEKRIQSYGLHTAYFIAYDGPVRFGGTAVCYYNHM